MVSESNSRRWPAHVRRLPGAGALALPDADLHYTAQFLRCESADLLFRALLEAVRWTQPRIRIAGKTINSPRLAAWYGDPGTVYSYSGLVNKPLPWLVELSDLRCRVEKETDCRFNSVLLNLYRDGQDSMGWHSDNEKELGNCPVIASVSLGEVRRFVLRHKKRKALPVQALGLAHGSLLLMRGTTQQYWRHAVPRTRREVGQRINLTFRNVSVDR